MTDALSLQRENEDLRAEVRYVREQLAGVVEEYVVLEATRDEETSQLRKRAEAAEAAVTELQAQLLEKEARYEREMADVRSSLAAESRSAAVQYATATRLRQDVAHMQARYAAQSGVVDMLREQLADSHELLALSNARRSEAATRAAAAIREVEGSNLASLSMGHR